MITLEMNTILPLLKPFTSMSQACTALYVQFNYKNYDITFQTRILANYFKIENLEAKDLSFFYKRAKVFDTIFPLQFIESLNKIHSELDLMANNCIQSFKAERTNCYCCESLLNERDKKVYPAQLYTFSKPSEPCEIVAISCNNCSAQHFPSYVQLNQNTRRFYGDCTDKRYISFTCETVYEILLLRSMTLDLVHKHATFDNFTRAYITARTYKS